MSHHIAPLETGKLFHADFKEEKTRTSVSKGRLFLNSEGWIPQSTGTNSHCLGYYRALCEIVAVGLQKEMSFGFQEGPGVV